MLTLEQAREAAGRGGVWMDRYRPGWRRKVNPRRLNLKLRDSCILGQVDGDYHQAVSRLRWKSERKTQLGFLIPWVETSWEEEAASWENLNRAWLEIHSNGHKSRKS